MSRIAIFFVAILFAAPMSATAQEQGFDDHIAGLDAQSGLVTLYADHKKGRVLMALPAADADGLIARMIYAEYLRSGLGSNPVGLDRSQPGDSQLVAFHRVGGKIYIEVENTSYVAVTDNALERDAVRQSFATSVIWSGDIIAEADDGRLLIDLSSFLLRDAHGIAARLAASGQGAFNQSKDLSYVDPAAVWAFPENVDMESVLTFQGTKPGAEVRATTPDARSVSLRMHHSFIALPDDGYKIRWADPRLGLVTQGIRDYAADLNAPVGRRMALRHRLIKKNPGAAVSEPVEPIIYYVDPGAPELVKKALVEGGNWWAEAFEAAGFKNAYRVEVLPEGAHPLDVRYNMINWVHRQTRGWSYGGSISDPRTGEILKGNVLLGSLRVRQDLMIFEGLVGADETGSGGSNDPLKASLARIRQLSAHEIGHTLGFGHNMAASTVLNKSSVMDYPAPDPRLDANGKIDLSRAYNVGMGAWDKFTTKWLYTEFADGVDEQVALDAIVDKGLASGLRYVSDPHSRPVSGAHAYGSVWDNGADPVAKLDEVMAIRRVALDNFGAHNVAVGQPQAQLRNVIVPIYLFHRYQLASAVKSIGGLEYSYKTRGDKQANMTIVAPARQMQALDSVLASITPEALDIRDEVLSVMNPGVNEYGNAVYREMLPTSATPMFDLMSAADVSAKMTLQAILNPARATRLVEQNRRDSAYPGLDSVMGHIEHQLFVVASKPDRNTSLRRLVQARYVEEAIRLSLFDVSHLVRMTVDTRLRALKDKLAGATGRFEHAGHNRALADRIDRHLRRVGEHDSFKLAGPEVPPGSPIGQGNMWTEQMMECWFCDLTMMAQ